MDFIPVPSRTINESFRIRSSPSLDMVIAFLSDSAYIVNADITKQNTSHHDIEFLRKRHHIVDLEGSWVIVSRLERNRRKRLIDHLSRQIDLAKKRPANWLVKYPSLEFPDDLEPRGKYGRPTQSVFKSFYEDVLIENSPCEAMQNDTFNECMFQMDDIPCAPNNSEASVCNSSSSATLEGLETASESDSGSRDTTYSMLSTITEESELNSNSDASIKKHLHVDSKGCECNTIKPSISEQVLHSFIGTSTILTQSVDASKRPPGKVRPESANHNLLKQHMNLLTKIIQKVEEVADDHIYPYRVSTECLDHSMIVIKNANELLDATIRSLAEPLTRTPTLIKNNKSNANNQQVPSVGFFSSKTKNRPRSGRSSSLDLVSVLFGRPESRNACGDFIDKNKADYKKLNVDICKLLEDDPSTENESACNKIRGKQSCGKATIARAGRSLIPVSIQRKRNRPISIFPGKSTKTSDLRAQFHKNQNSKVIRKIPTPVTVHQIEKEKGSPLLPKRYIQQSVQNEELQKDSSAVKPTKASILRQNYIQGSMKSQQQSTTKKPASRPKPVRQPVIKSKFKAGNTRDREKVESLKKQGNLKVNALPLTKSKFTPARIHRSSKFTDLTVI